MSLHLVFSQNGLSACLQRRRPADPVLMLGDGVYACQQWLHEQLPSDLAFVLAADAATRGIGDEQRGDITAVDYTEFVALTEAHSPIVSWKD